MKLEELVHALRSAGVRRLRVAQQNNCYSMQVDLHDKTLSIDEIELGDTIPAPPPFEQETDLAEPDKPAGICIALGCMEPGGWHFDARYCGPHGRSAAGIKP